MKRLNSNMTDITPNSTFLIAGIVFVTIAVIGQSKLGFIEINPGCFGRLLALFIGISSLLYALGLLNFSGATIDLLRTSLTEQIKQSISYINELLQGS
ncbi:hypothetical protein GJB62_15370 [Nostoc sp. ATCC 53789]|nr:hypothetical protein GJB62_15370 [Nostoc sp. ATCC 53789]QLE49975.1 hypothetical protein FD724_19035 [Nostoc sp. C057]